MIYHFLTESFDLDSFLLKVIFQFCNNFAHCAYRDIDDRSYSINFKKNSKSLSDLKNHNYVITIIFFADVDHFKRLNH